MCHSNFLQKNCCCTSVSFLRSFYCSFPFYLFIKHFSNVTLISPPLHWSCQFSSSHLKIPLRKTPTCFFLRWKTCSLLSLLKMNSLICNCLFSFSMQVFRPITIVSFCLTYCAKQSLLIFLSFLGQLPCSASQCKSSPSIFRIFFSRLLASSIPTLHHCKLPYFSFKSTFWRYTRNLLKSFILEIYKNSFSSSSTYLFVQLPQCKYSNPSWS